jgi:signal transduction histidine kinase
LGVTREIDGWGGDVMTSELLLEATPIAGSALAPESLDTVRALCHDLRQPLAAIRLLAATEGGDVRRRLDGILDQAQWLTDVVEGVIGDAVEDHLESVDVADLVSHSVLRARLTAECQIGSSHTVDAVAIAAPVALSRALNCLLDNAVRAAGPGGHVTVEVTGTAQEIVIQVIDDGPGLGRVLAQSSLGLTITRALVCACRGAFKLKPGAAGGVVAQIAVPRLISTAVAS